MIRSPRLIAVSSAVGTLYSSTTPTTVGAAPHRKIGFDEMPGGAGSECDVLRLVVALQPADLAHQCARQRLLELRIVLEAPTGQRLIAGPDDAPVRAVEVRPQDLRHGAQVVGEFLQCLACATAVVGEYTVTISLGRQDALQELLRDRHLAIEHCRGQKTAHQHGRRNGQRGYHRGARDGEPDTQIEAGGVHG